MSQSAQVRLAIAGAGGRMGRALLEAAAAISSVKICGALEHEDSPLLASDAGMLCSSAAGVLVSAELATGLATADVLVDFTRPEGTLRHLEYCRNHGINLVIGTTGFSVEQKKLIETAAKEIGIVFAPNMSVGVNVMLELVAIATRALHEQYDIEIIETHHKMKVDAPSGTALQMGEIAAKSMGKALGDIAVFDRHGSTGERKSGSIGFSAIRGGDVIGDHTVLFAGPGERIEISHKSSTRTNYAQGAMRAVLFLADKKTGLFDMSDVLGLKQAD
jgi:4-hydroxy-tetrahydrodipicolinate reductase